MTSTDDRWGLRKVGELGVTLEGVGQEVVFENDVVRVWAIRLAAGETQQFHLHRHPYVVISVRGADNRIETIFGDTRSTSEPAGNVVWRGDPGPVHRLTNVSDEAYECRLMELKKEVFDLD